MCVKLAFLGTGTCNATPRNPSAMAISNGKDIALIDCGGGCYHQIARLGDPSFSHEKISTVLLTHFHPDHVTGLIDLIWGEMWDTAIARRAPLTVAGPPGLNKFIKSLLLPFIGEHRIPFAIRTEELGHGDTYRGAFFTASAHKLSHVDASTGYLLEAGGIKLGVTGDTGFCDNLLTLLLKSDMAIIEWSNLDREITPIHISNGDIMRLLQTGAIPPKVYFTHMYPLPGITFDHLVEIKKEILGAEAGKFFFPQDLDIIELH